MFNRIDIHSAIFYRPVRRTRLTQIIEYQIPVAPFSFKSVVSQLVNSSSLAKRNPPEVGQT
jgi:hypothetical protein